MFGDLMGMMGKLKETQQKVKAVKERLHSVILSEESDDGFITVTITANRTLKSIHIDDSLLSDKKKLETSLVQTLNKAIDKAGTLSETELAAVAKEGIPNIPGIDSLFK